MQRKFTYLSGEICLTCDASQLLFEHVSGQLNQMSGRPGGYSSEIERILIATQQRRIAPDRATGQVIKQKSADGIVAKCPA